jgi:hypothetical protein
MAWTTPRTWLAGELVKENDLNIHVRDNMNLLATPLDTTTGKIVALDSTRVANLSGANLTGVAKLAAANVYTAGVNNFNGGATTRLVLPVGADKWAT